MSRLVGNSSCNKRRCFHASFSIIIDIRVSNQPKLFCMFSLCRQFHWLEMHEVRWEQEGRSSSLEFRLISNAQITAENDWLLQKMPWTLPPKDCHQELGISFQPIRKVPCRFVHILTDTTLYFGPMFLLPGWNIKWKRVPERWWKLLARIC